MFKNFDATTYIVFGVVVLAIWVALSYYLGRWIFSIDKQLDNQRRQIDILSKLAEKMGVEFNTPIITEKKENRETTNPVVVVVLVIVIAVVLVIVATGNA